MIGTRILSEDKNRICLFKILQGHGAFADADGFTHRIPEGS
jgi:hypothetical protein